MLERNREKKIEEILIKTRKERLTAKFENFLKILELTLLRCRMRIKKRFVVHAQVQIQ
jgi:hypothetical protein